ncbi:hypothetical protein EBR43_07165 [bacterium]|nr:hypothetical protein [bacterium]
MNHDEQTKKTLASSELQRQLVAKKKNPEFVWLKVKKHHTAFMVGDLNIKGMVKNRKLARTLHHVRWGQFLVCLSYKCEPAGKTMHNIGRYEPTSKVCSCCGYKMEAMPLSVREWQCPSCNQLHDRDINAGRNIRAIG